MGTPQDTRRLLRGVIPRNWYEVHGHDRPPSYGAVRHRTVTNFHVHAVHEQDRMDQIERPRAPVGHDAQASSVIVETVSMPYVPT